MPSPLPANVEQVLDGAIVDEDVILAALEAPRSHKLLCLLQRSYSRIERSAWNEARSDAEIVINYCSGEIQEEARLVRAVTFLGAGEWALAETALTSVLEAATLAKHRLHVTRINRAFGRSRNGDLIGAINDYSLVIEDSDSDELKGVCYVGRSHCCKAMRAPSLERSDLWNVVKSGTEDIQNLMYSIMQRALSFGKCGLYRKEADHYREIIQSPRSPLLYVSMARNNLAITQYLVGESEVALWELNQLSQDVATLDGVRWMARRNRAILNLKLDKEQDCLRDLHLVEKMRGANAEFTQQINAILRILTVPQPQRKHQELAILEGIEAIRLNGKANLILI